MYSARLTVGAEMLPHLSLFVGASFNMAFVEDEQLNFGPGSFAEGEVYDLRQVMWPGTFAGLRLDI